MQYRSIGPGGFIRQGPGDQQPPIPPAPPRRLVPAKPSPEVADKTSLLDLNDRICKWPIGHPGEPDFHFCGHPSNPGFPYCVEHCGVAYQAQLPRRDRRPPPPLPFGGPRVRWRKLLPAAQPWGGNHSPQSEWWRGPARARCDADVRLCRGERDSRPRVGPAEPTDVSGLTRHHGPVARNWNL